MHLPPAARLQAVAYRGRATSTPPQRRCVPGCRAAKQSSSPFLFFVGHVARRSTCDSRITDGAVNYPEEREARWRRREGGCDVVGPDGTAEVRVNSRITDGAVNAPDVDEESDLEEPCRCACFADGERGTEALPRWARLVPRRTPERKTWCRGELRERLGAGELKREKDLFNVFKTHLKIAVRPHLSTNKHTSTTYLPPLTGRPAHATPRVALSLLRARSLSQRWT